MKAFHEENGWFQSYFQYNFLRLSTSPLGLKYSLLTTLLELVHALVKLRCIIIILSF